MASAKVKLVKAESYSDRRGRNWKKGDQHIITDGADILYYRQQPEFTVTMLQAPKPKPPPEPVADDEGDDEGPLTEADFKKMSKAALIEHAADEHDLALDDSMKKPEMIQHILDAQAGAA